MPFLVFSPTQMAIKRLNDQLLQQSSALQALQTCYLSLQESLQAVHRRANLRHVLCAQSKTRPESVLTPPSQPGIALRASGPECLAAPYFYAAAGSRSCSCRRFSSSRRMSRLSRRRRSKAHASLSVRSACFGSAWDKT